MEFTFKLLSIEHRTLSTPVEIEVLGSNKEDATEKLLKIIDDVFSIPVGAKPEYQLIKISTVVF